MDDLTMLFKPSPATLLIRMADQTDAAAISAMAIATLRQTKAAECRPAVVEALAADFSCEKFRAAMARRKTLVAVMHGAIIGTAGLETAKVQAVFVAPDWQRQGIGAALLASVLATHGSRSVTVQTGAKNVPALSLYARAGFLELRRWFVGREPLELVKLLHTASVNSNEAKNAAA